MTEYARYGKGAVRRDSRRGEWEEIALSEVPQEIRAGWKAQDERKARVAEFGYDPQEPPVPFAVVTKHEG